MRVCQVISSDLPILPTGKRRWGAVELIMSEYQKNLKKINVDVDFKYLNDVKPDDYDIVHIHVANLCIEAKKRGIDYVYSNHDHTSVHYGKGSWLYKQQLEAIKGSVFSICHAESVMSFFDETDKLFYLPHGVDMDYYTPPERMESRIDKLLMVASNGMAGDYGIDRKGFRLGIEAAKKLNMPITIVGSEANAKFFEIHKDLAECPLVTINSSNPTEDEKLNYYQTHSVFLHPSYLEFGSPNLTLLEAWSCNLPIVAAYDGRMKFEGMSVLNALDVDEITIKIKNILNNYESIVKSMEFTRSHEHDWSSVVNQLIKMYWAASDNLLFPSYGSSFVQKKYKNVYA